MENNNKNIEQENLRLLNKQLEISKEDSQEQDRQTSLLSSMNEVVGNVFIKLGIFANLIAKGLVALSIIGKLTSAGKSLSDSKVETKAAKDNFFNINNDSNSSIDDVSVARDLYTKAIQKQSAEQIIFNNDLVRIFSSNLTNLFGPGLGKAIRDFTTSTVFLTKMVEQYGSTDVMKKVKEKTNTKNPKKILDNEINTEAKKQLASKNASKDPFIRDLQKLIDESRVNINKEVRGGLSTLRSANSLNKSIKRQFEDENVVGRPKTYKTEQEQKDANLFGTNKARYIKKNQEAYNEALQDEALAKKKLHDDAIKFARDEANRNKVTGNRAKGKTTENRYDPSKYLNSGFIANVEIPGLEGLTTVLKYILQASQKIQAGNVPFGGTKTGNNSNGKKKVNSGRTDGKDPWAKYDIFKASSGEKKAKDAINGMFGGIADALKSVIDNTFGKIPGLGKSVQSFTSMITPGLVKLGVVGGIAALAVGGLVASFKSFQKTIKLLSDQMEALSKIDYLLQNREYGTDSTSVVRKGMASSAKIGISGTNYAGQFASIAEALKNLGETSANTANYSAQIIQRGADVGSFSNIDPTRFTEAVTAAIASSEFSRLRNMGITIRKEDLNAIAKQMGSKSFDNLGASDRSEILMKEIFEKTKFAEGNFQKTLKDSIPNLEKSIAAYKEQNSVMDPMNVLWTSLYKEWLKFELALHKAVSSIYKFTRGLTASGRGSNLADKAGSAQTPKEFANLVNKATKEYYKDKEFKSESYSSMDANKQKAEQLQAIVSKKEQALIDSKIDNEGKGIIGKLTSWVDEIKQGKDVKNSQKELSKVEQSIADNDKLIEVANELIHAADANGKSQRDLIGALTSKDSDTVALKEAINNAYLGRDKETLASKNNLSPEAKREKLLQSISDRLLIIDKAQQDYNGGLINQEEFKKRSNVFSLEAATLKSLTDKMDEYFSKIITGETLSTLQREEYDMMFETLTAYSESANKNEGDAYTKSYNDTMKKDSEEQMYTFEKLTRMETVFEKEYEKIDGRFNDISSGKARPVNSSKESEVDYINRRKGELEALQTQLRAQIDGINAAIITTYTTSMLEGTNNFLNDISEFNSAITNMIENGSDFSSVADAMAKFTKGFGSSINLIQKGLQQAMAKAEMDGDTEKAGKLKKSLGQTTALASAMPGVGAAMAGAQIIGGIASAIQGALSAAGIKENNKMIDLLNDQVTIQENQLNELESLNASEDYANRKEDLQDIGKEVSAEEKLERLQKKLDNTNATMSERGLKTDISGDEYKALAQAAGEKINISSGFKNSAGEYIVGGGTNSNKGWNAKVRAEVQRLRDAGYHDAANTLANGMNTTWSDDERLGVIANTEEAIRIQQETKGKSVGLYDEQLDIMEDIAELELEISKANISHIKEAKLMTEEYKKQLGILRQMLPTQEQLGVAQLKAFQNTTTNGIDNPNKNNNVFVMDTE